MIVKVGPLRVQDDQEGGESIYIMDQTDVCSVDVENLSGPFFDFLYEWFECIIQSLLIVTAAFMFIFRVVDVSGNSMYPTLCDLDKVLILKWQYTPAAGDVVVIRRGQYLDEPLIKRLIATEGQKISIDFSTGQIEVDGEVLKEVYLKEQMWLEGDNDIPDLIPYGYCFVMGDNRNHSRDSRFRDVGLIKNTDVVGKALLVFHPLGRFRVVR